MMAEHEITIGELGRALQEFRSDTKAALSNLEHKVDGILAEAEARSAEKVAVLRTEMALKHSALEARTKVLEKALWGVIGFFILAIGTGIVNLVIIH